MVESRHLKPVIAGLPIGPDPSGRKVLAGTLQVLNVADWSLLAKPAAIGYRHEGHNFA